MLVSGCLNCDDRSYVGLGIKARLSTKVRLTGAEDCGLKLCIQGSGSRGFRFGSAGDSRATVPGLPSSVAFRS